MAALEEAIKAVKNCCGVTSIDISPILADPGLFAQACDDIYQMYEREVFDIIITKLTGTLFAAALAARMGKGLIITTCVKPTDGYLTEDIEGNSGSFSVGMPEGFIRKGTKAVVVVDQISHGRDIKAAINMVEKQGDRYQGQRFRRGIRDQRQEEGDQGIPCREQAVHRRLLKPAGPVRGLSNHSFLNADTAKMNGRWTVLPFSQNCIMLSG